MNSPQIENGFTRIASELLDAIIRFDFSKREYQVLLAVIRKTYGYGKKEDDLGISQITKMTGLHKTHAAKTVRDLINKDVLYRKDGQFAHIVGLNKNYTKWGVTKTVTSDQNSHPKKGEILGKGVTKTVTPPVTKTVTPPVTKTVTPPVTKTVTTIDNQPIDNQPIDNQPIEILLPPPQVIPSSNETEKEKRGGGDFLVELIFPASLSRMEQQTATQMLGAVNGSAQALLDALEASIQTGQVKKNPLALLGGMVRRYEAGTFDPAPGAHIAADREKRLTTRRNVEIQTNVDGDAVLRELEALRAKKQAQKQARIVR
jgi:phage replication O-like protein O